MIARWVSAAVLAVMTCAAAAGPASAQTPKLLVKALYGEPDLNIERLARGNYLAADLEAALRADPPGGRLGSGDFDYRYGSRDARVRGLQFLEEIDNSEARVVVVFKNFGRPESVDWLLCRRAAGDWRIMDASSNSYRDKEPWDLRQMLGLSSSVVKC